MTIHPDDLTAPLVARLIAEQFPDWAALPIRPVQLSGWDNRTFRLGDTMSVRLPSAGRYAAQVEKEQRWLPWLAPRLPLPIPVPQAQGRPSELFPWPWSVYRWLDGEPASAGHIAHLPTFARDLATFLAALQGLDATSGPPAGPHNFFRGGPLSVYDAETRQATSALGGELDARAVTEVWEAALQTHWSGPPVWVHGDVAVGNLLVTNGRLSAVIDFGGLGVGDPACDTVMAWTLFRDESRSAFRAALGLDDATWARGRGWALWKALVTLAGMLDPDPAKMAPARQVIAEVLADHQRGR